MFTHLVWLLACSGSSFGSVLYGSQSIDNPYLLPRQNNATSTDLAAAPQPTSYLTPIASSGDESQGSVGLVDKTTWQWGADGAWANVTAVSTSADIKYLTVEAFDKDIKDVICTSTGITFTFSEQSAYDAAKTAWSWLSASDSRTVVAVLNHATCGTDGGRHPYNVTQIQFQENLKIAFTSVAAKWADVLGDYKLSLRPAAASNTVGNAVEKRLSKKGFASFDKSFANNNIISRDLSGVTLGLGCDPCSVTGGINIDFEAGLFSVASLSLGSVGLSAQIALALSASGTLNTQFDESITIISVPVGPLAIDALGIKVGPVIEVLASVALSNISAEAAISLGANIAVADSTVSLSVPSFDGSTSGGFGTTFTQIGPTLSGEVSAALTFFPTIALELACTFPGFPDFSAGIEALAPRFNVNGAVSAASDGSVCGGAGLAGVSLEVGADAVLQAFGDFGKVDITNPEHSFVLTSTSTQLFSTCLAVGGATATPTVTTPPSFPLPTEVVVGSCRSVTFTGDLLSLSGTEIVTTATRTNVQFVCQAPTAFRASFNCEGEDTCDDGGSNWCLIVPNGPIITAAGCSAKTSAVLATTTASV